MFGSLGFPEIVMIMLVALILFGPKKLPEIAKLLGNTIREFKKTINEAKATIQDEIDKADISEDLESIKNDLNEVTKIKSSIKDSIKNEFKKFDISNDINEINKEIEESGDDIDRK